MEFVKNKQTKEIFDAETDIGKRVAREAQNRGLIVRPLGSMAVMSPPLIMTSAQTDTFVEVLRDSINAASASVGN